MLSSRPTEKKNCIYQRVCVFIVIMDVLNYFQGRIGKKKKIGRTPFFPNK